MIREHIPFTVLPNYVLQNYTENGMALAVWCHLVSLPENFNVNKAYLRNKFKVGINRIDSVMADLAAHNLISYHYERDAQMRMNGVRIIVKNGEEYYEKHVINQQLNSTPMEFIGMDNHHYKRKDIKKEKIKSKAKAKSICASEDARDGFDEFWSEHPKKVDKKRAEKAWVKNECAKVKDQIMEALRLHKLHTWANTEKQYIQSPDRWLNGHRWEDEIIFAQPKKESAVDYATRQTKHLNPVRILDETEVIVSRDDEWPF